MAKLRIYKFPDEVLLKKANPVDRVEKEHQKLGDDMLETMYEAPGIGLAANQVGVLKRILVFDTEYEVKEDPELEGMIAEIQGEVVKGGEIIHRKPKILINPEIIHKEGKIIYCEGCLSVPEYTAEVERAARIKIQYQDVDGLTQTMDLEGLNAICIQHEIDHLNGKLFIDRLTPLKKEIVKKQLKKERAEREKKKS